MHVNHALTYTQCVAAEIRAEMARQRLSQLELGLLIGMTAQALSRRLSGSMAFRLDEIDNIARALRVPVAELTNPRSPARAS